MSISITTADVRRKAGIADTDTTHDTAIAALITEMQGALEYSIAEAHLADTANTNLQATLKLGMLEMIAGEFIEQLMREYGGSEQFSVAGVTVGAPAQRGVELVQQGATRLAPYLRAALPFGSDTASQSTTTDSEPVFADIPEAW